MAEVFNQLSESATNSPRSNDAHTHRLIARALPLLMNEVRHVGALQRKGANPSDRRLRLRSAFSLLGTNAAPLIPELRLDFLSSENPADSGWGLIQTGERGWSVLLEGLTNPSPQVRFASAAAMPSMDENAVKVALPHLLEFLTNGTAPLRCITAQNLGYLNAQSNVIMPALVRTLREDTDTVVRVAAAKSLGSIAATNKAALDALKRSSVEDNDELVRRMVLLVLKGLIQQTSGSEGFLLPR